MKAGELTSFAAGQQRLFEASTSPAERKERGHFGTSPSVAEFMAAMFSRPSGTSLRILDAGAGVGMLSAAICQRALNENWRQKLCFELWETDPKAAPRLEATMQQCRKVLERAGRDMAYIIHVEDFILANRDRTLLQPGSEARFHLSILNPPYFKLRKDSEQARAMPHIVHGQPNIYALFMARAVELLVPHGEIVAITPRSYFNGPYFRRFRTWFFDRVATRQIHIFESRTEAFKDQAVLQENVILHAEKGGASGDVLLTASSGRDFERIQRTHVPDSQLIDDSYGHRVVRVPSNNLEADVIQAMDSLPSRFRDLGMEISTGPIVVFRALEHLRGERGRDTAPLLWMHNVRPFITQFPPANGKPTHIQVSRASRKLLVPAKTYVLLKRFTAKEERRRLVAGIMRRSDSYSEWVGLEGHLNYIYRPSGELSQAEAYGLATFLNSAFVDRYFRAISGNTQVNATEIRGLPVPAADVLTELGEVMKRRKSIDAGAVERAVGRALQLPTRLVDQLIEAET